MIIVLMEALMLIPALGREDSASDQDSNDELRFEHRIVSSDVPTFKYDINAVVVTVLEAGRKAGIQKGWKLAAIEGVPVENGAEAREEIHRCHCMYRKFEVKFFVGNVEEKAVTKAESKAVAKVQAVAIDIKAEGPGKNVESKVDEKAVKGKMKKDETVRVVT